MRTIVSRTFRAFEVRDYRLLALTQFASIVGTIVHGLGVAWLVLSFEGAGLALGFVTGAQFLPLLLVGPLGGVIADQHDKRRLLLVTQTGMAISAAVLAVLTITDHISVAGVAALALFQGAFASVDAPTRNALVADLVGRERIANADSLHEVSVNTARIVAPILGGTLIAVFGVAACFVVNALSFIPAALAVWSLRPVPALQAGGRHRDHLREGFSYAWGNPGIRSLLVLAASIGVFFNFGIVMPLLARDTFAGGPQTLAAMITAVGIGAVIGSFVLASSGDPTPRRLERLGVAFAVFVLLAAAAPNLHAALGALAGAGAAGVSVYAVGSSLLQLRCDPVVRSRLLALWTVAAVGTAAVTGPLTGWIAVEIGPRGAMTAIAGALLLATLAPRQKLAALADDRSHNTDGGGFRAAG